MNQTMQEAVATYQHALDLFAVQVFSFVAGNFGTIVRDVLIGFGRPAITRDWRFGGCPRTNVLVDPKDFTQTVSLF
jgi:hypothetical protein